MCIYLNGYCVMCSLRVCNAYIFYESYRIYFTIYTANTHRTHNTAQQAKYNKTKIDKPKITYAVKWFRHRQKCAHTQMHTLIKYTIYVYYQLAIAQTDK